MANAAGGEPLPGPADLSFDMPTQFADMVLYALFCMIPDLDFYHFFQCMWFYIHFCDKTRLTDDD